MLVACALAPAGADLSAAVEHLGNGVKSWDLLLAGAAASKIRPQLAARLSGDAMRTEAGRAAAADLGVATRAIAGRGRFMAGELVRVLEVLHAANILAVPFKGPAFAARLGEAPGSREMADLDVFVRIPDVVRAAYALAAIGYEPVLPPQALESPWLTRVNSELVLFRPRESTQLELHWETAPHWYPAPCTAADVMGSLAEGAFFGCAIQSPAPEELFLIHVTDGMKSCGRGIRWIADVVKILRQHSDLDWDRIRRTAARNGGLNSVRVALCVLDGLAGDVARVLNIPALAVRLPARAQALAGEAGRAARLARAIREIRRGLHDAVAGGAVAHFLWALRVADRPTRTARSIFRYLSRPTVADLAAMPPRGESETALRLRAFRRRLGGLVP